MPRIKSSIVYFCSNPIKKLLCGLFVPYRFFFISPNLNTLPLPINLNIPTTVRLQMVLDKLGQKLREGFRTHINLSCLFSKSQSVILLPS
jgi:hypothetical protein